MRNRRILLTAAGVAVLTAALAGTTLQNVVGTIMDSAAAAPAEGVQLTFFDSVNAEQLASATTDGNGQYDTGNLPAGNYRVRFSGEFLRPQYLGTGGSDLFCSGAIVPVLASSTRELDAGVPLSKDNGGGAIEVEDPAKVAEETNGPTDPSSGPPPYSVFGVVVDDATGAPLQGIRVSLLAASNALVITTVTTDADGSYRVELTGSLPPSLKVRFTDPSGSHSPEFHGADADAFCTAATVVAGPTGQADGFLDKVPPDQLTQEVAETVESYGLPATVATVLETPLTQARKMLADGNPGNDSGACGQLTSFVHRVDAQEKKGTLNLAQANELRSMTVNLRGNLGCQ